MSWLRPDDDEDDELDPPPYDPPPVDVSEIRKQVMKQIEALLPYAIDEATPHVLDSWVDYQIDIEVARRVRHYTRYRAMLLDRLVEARADEAYERILDQTTQQELAEIRLARRAAVAELLGAEEALGDLRRRGSPGRADVPGQRPQE